MLPLYDAPFALNSVYDLYAPTMFRFVTGHPGPNQMHPISQVAVTPPSDAAYTLEVGSESALSAAGNRIIGMPDAEWSEVLVEEGVAYRAFGPVGAMYKHAPLIFALSGNTLEGQAHKISVKYRDDNHEPVFFEAYSQVKRGYVRLGSFENQADGQWKWLHVTIQPETLGEQFFGHLAHAAYHVSHGGYMRGLYELTQDERFRIYAERWESYSQKRLAAETAYREAVAAATGDAALARERVAAALEIWPDYEEAKQLHAQLQYTTNWSRTARVIRSTPFYPPPHGPSAALDGDESTYAAAVEGTRGAFVLDLGQPRMIGRVTLVWYDAVNYPTHFYLQANIGGRWEPIVAESEWFPAAGLRYVKPLRQPVLAQEIRLVVDAAAGQNRLLLREMLLEGN
jgi:hypothetical protein